MFYQYHLHCTFSQLLFCTVLITALCTVLYCIDYCIVQYYTIIIVNSIINHYYTCNAVLYMYMYMYFTVKLQFVPFLSLCSISDPRSNKSSTRSS